MAIIFSGLGTSGKSTGTGRRAAFSEFPAYCIQMVLAVTTRFPSSFESTTSCRLHQSAEPCKDGGQALGEKSGLPQFASFASRRFHPVFLKLKSSQPSLWLPGLSAPFQEVRMPLGQRREQPASAWAAASSFVPSLCCSVLPMASGHISWWATEMKLLLINCN